MADALRNSPFERDVEQAIIALKKGSCLLKYGRRGKPKFCPFRLSADESMLIWYAGKYEKKLVLNTVSKIIPGQRTAIFQRYPRPDKEYQSFSLIYYDRSLDLICKDKDEAEVWFVGLKALISHGNCLKRLGSKGDKLSDSNSHKHSPLTLPFDPDDNQPVRLISENPPLNGFGRVFSDVILYSSQKESVHSDSVTNSLSSVSTTTADNSNERGSTSENFRVSLSSAVSSSSHGSGHEDIDALGDVYIWGQSVGDGALGGGIHKVDSTLGIKVDASLPKALESAVVLDINYISCGSRHAALVTKHGEVFTWGEESGGRLGHGIDADVLQPKLVNILTGMNVDFVECGEYHTCAVTLSGDLYTWGDGVHSSGLLGHGNEVSHWVPKLVTGQMVGVHVSSVSCGPWHTAVLTSSGQLFTFGDGTFGALGHGDRRSLNTPREVEALRGLRAISTACGAWHTAAVVKIESQLSSDSVVSAKLFTWGDGDKGQLGHGDGEPRLVPACVASLTEPSFCQVSCGHDITVALSTSGRIYTIGNTVYGQLGNPGADGKSPTLVEGKLSDCFVQGLACGSHHVAVLTSKSEVYTWGKGTNGQLGHGDHDNRNIPTLVDTLKDKQVKSVSCGSNFTAVICLHKWASSSDQSLCSGCHLPFGFRRKRHNCYNCGQVFCKSCSSRKSIRAALAPNIHKSYRVCDDCYTKLKKTLESGIHSRVSKQKNANQTQISSQLAERETLVSRLSSFGSFKGESRHLKQNGKSDNYSNRMFSILNDSPQRGSIQMTKSQSIVIPGSPKKIYTGSLSTSLVSLISGTMSTDVSSSEVIIDELEKTNESLREEVARLKLQVEDLTNKSQNMEDKLERKSNQLEEALAKAEEEAKKCKAAKEVIKSLTTQLKDMAERAPDISKNDHSMSDASHSSNSPNSVLSGSKSDRVLNLHSQESNIYNSVSLPSNATYTLEVAEKVEQTEPGVYITLLSSPSGQIYLKRIRFSRKRFSEQQAETWWAINKSKLQEKYIFPAGGRSMSSAISLPSTKKDGPNE
ncbi:Ultraviolet-B receptor UVR8 [Apostasia shenzhenica]|uniref:Ultraviolet-B receptor UVR8 n=1 Tax=Apostasia shenzhenica TaxID=1088818 RepID=A0A2I0A702_9ASPA|nr:Ultraviolet-B receptor UVR8 [Apostasia shenzhenica]